MRRKYESRSTAIDVARGIAAILMLIGHLELNARVDQFIYSFHMPLFFIISGMTMKAEENLPAYIRKRIRRILVPYIVFALIFTDLKYVNWLYCLYGSSRGLSAAESLTSLWFLPCLFCADLVFHLILRVCGDERTMIPAVIACAAAGISITWFLTPVHNLPFSFDIALAAVPFLMIGHLLRKHVGRVRKYAEKTHVNLMAAVLMLGAVSVLCFLNLPPSSSAGEPHVEMAIGSYGNLFLFYFTAVLGSFAVILIAKAAGHKLKMIEYFGRCTITCLVIHRSVFALLLRVGLWLNLNASVITAMELVMTIVITFIAETVIERYAPNLIGLTEQPQFSE